MEKVSIIIELKDKISAALGKIEDAFEQVDKEIKNAQSSTSRFQSVCDKLKMPQLDAFFNIVDKVGGAFLSVSEAGMSFGQSMADLSSITGITGKELENLEKRSRELGASSGLGADTAARAYSILASNIEISKIGIEGLNTLQEKSITLAQAAGMSLDGAATALAGTVNQFGLGAEEADRVINVLAAGSKYGAAEIEDLTQSFKIVGAAASAMGMNVESTAGALEVLSQANLKGSEAGTALRNIILKLNTELGVNLGETSLGTALEALKPKLTDATYLSKVFGMENIAAAQFLIQNAAAVDEMTAQVTGTSIAQEQAAIRTATSAQKMAELRAQIDNIKIGLTEFTGSLTPYMAIVAENAAALAGILEIGKYLYGGIVKVSKVIGILTKGTLAQNIATKAATVATQTWTVVQKALNLALSMNPIGIVIKALGLLAAGIAIAYNKCDGFRAICDKVWGAIKNVASLIWGSLVKAFEKVSGAIQTAWNWLKKFLGIKDDSPVDSTTQAINAQTDAINENTAAKINNTAVPFDFVLPDTQNTPISTTTPTVQPEIKVRPKLDLPDMKKIAGPIETLAQKDLTIRLGLSGVKPVIKDVKDCSAQIETIAKQGNTASEAMRGMSSIMSSMGKIVGEGANKWLEWGANIVNAIAAAIPAIMALIPVKQAETTANTAAAATGAASSVASIPIVGPIMAVAAIASVLGAIASIPKFANGGIAYGPTLGLFGEYANAASNPEVVAPLNKLKSLIGVDNNGRKGKVEFKIKGRTLKGLLEKESRISYRTNG